MYCTECIFGISYNTISSQTIALLLSVLLHLCDSRTNSSFTPSRPVCPGEQVQFNCTVVDDGRPNPGYTFWNNSAVREICVFSHFLGRDRIPDQCGPFTAQLHLEGLGSSCYFSSFTAIARTELNNSLVQCLGPSVSHLVGSDTLKIIGLCNEYTACKLVRAFGLNCMCSHCTPFVIAHCSHAHGLHACMHSSTHSCTARCVEQ